MTNEQGWNLDNSYSQLPSVFYSRLKPKPVEMPQLVILNECFAETLGLERNELKREEIVQIFAGNQLPPGSEPIAQAYAGHQFGHFTMLGDGRAILLGEQLTPTGDRVDIQLKGAGRTPYSRGGDGRAALGPMLREYIISEAMYALGIPTSRSLAVVKTGEMVYRETELDGAILTRVAASHIRVGTFQYIAQYGEKDELQALADYTIERHYAYIADDHQRYLRLLEEVIKKQASLVAKWQLVGFVHGVMNTDNVTISGETIDYGPCAFIDQYDPATVFSSIDRQGRYAFGNQPYMAAWGLARLAESILPLLHENKEQAVKLAEGAIATFSESFQEEWLTGMRKKLGLVDQVDGDQKLVDNLLKMMETHEADYTNTFRALTLDQLDDEALFETDSFQAWHKQWKERLANQGHSEDFVQERMRKSNPVVIPRNHRVEEALAAAVDNDYDVLKQLLDVLANPYDYSLNLTKYGQPPAPSDRPYQTFCGT
ncbi:protein adenylyltransferase SelO [Halalkalibacter hemicellulosilyticus]|uniref:Protein nucleotidyltransferase YdiU n=1 Tax=Halalkalibacter hemicellulosilyticusJCM 9152 TaxID=1236971 RepID=W4QD49_9BACI|nr:YdiU family protein [Halalkalibacter hemicellulosilyticus]GAE29608.1 selenoprotein O and cysteine-containing homologs [Halalkalibacter hemicellulosilyticusJCM 9152]